jgi:hypothetical protein
VDLLENVRSQILLQVFAIGLSIASQFRHYLFQVSFCSVVHRFHYYMKSDRLRPSFIRAAARRQRLAWPIKVSNIGSDKSFAALTEAIKVNDAAMHY